MNITTAANQIFTLDLHPAKRSQPNSFGCEPKGPAGSYRLSYTSNDAAKMERVTQEGLSNDCNYPDQSMDTPQCK